MPKVVKNVALKSAIFASGRTQVEIATSVGRSRTWISHVVQGRWNVKPEEAEELARELGMSVDELFPDVVSA